MPEDENAINTQSSNISITFGFMVRGDTQIASVHCNDNHLQQSNLIALTEVCVWGGGAQTRKLQLCTEQQTKKLLRGISDRGSLEECLSGKKIWSPLWVVFWHLLDNFVYCREITMKQPSWSWGVSDLLGITFYCACCYTTCIIIIIRNKTCKLIFYVHLCNPWGQ